MTLAEAVAKSKITGPEHRELVRAKMLAADDWSRARFASTSGFTEDQRVDHEIVVQAAYTKFADACNALFDFERRAKP